MPGQAQPPPVARSRARPDPSRWGPGRQRRRRFAQKIEADSARGGDAETVAAEVERSDTARTRTSPPLEEGAPGRPSRGLLSDVANVLALADHTVDGTLILRPNGSPEGRRPRRHQPGKPPPVVRQSDPCLLPMTSRAGIWSQQPVRPRVELTVDLHDVSVLTWV